MSEAIRYIEKGNAIQDFFMRFSQLKLTKQEKYEIIDNINRHLNEQIEKYGYYPITKETFMNAFVGHGNGLSINLLYYKDKLVLNVYNYKNLVISIKYNMKKKVFSKVLLGSFEKDIEEVRLKKVFDNLLVISKMEYKEV